MTRTLGISLGTRIVGVAVAIDGRLTECRVRTFPERWTKHKLAFMLSRFGKLIDRYQADTLVVKVPISAHRSRSLNVLILELGKLAERKHVRVMACTIHDLKLHYAADGRSSRQVLIEALLEEYPNSVLHSVQVKALSTQRPYHGKLFEAVACLGLVKATHG